MRHYIKFNNLNIRGIPGSKISLEIKKGDIVAVTGPTGAGKSTLVGYIAGIVRPESIGTILIDGLDPFSQLDERKIHRMCGIVSQDPDQDIVFNSVLKDIVFAPENIGLDKSRISRRASNYFKHFKLGKKQRRDYNQISLSEKQRAVLTSELIMHQDILILDDAVSMQDSETGYSILKSVISSARKRKQTVIFVSQKQRELELADKIIELRDGTAEYKQLNEISSILPDFSVEEGEEVAGVQFKIGKGRVVRDSQDPDSQAGDTAISLSDVFFSYGKDKLVQEFEYRFCRGCEYHITGKSGSGKTTFLKMLAGIQRERSGDVKRFGRTAMAMQLPSEQLFEDTVIEDVMYQKRLLGVPKPDARRAAETMLTNLGIAKSKWEKHPLHLSMGEQRLVLLAGVFLAEADILLLDKPYAGLDTDGYYKVRYLIEEMLKEGKCVITVD
jgi:energy-coupling factor transporter ATP-binding protein EcfA2